MSSLLQKAPLTLLLKPLLWSHSSPLAIQCPGLPFPLVQLQMPGHLEQAPVSLWVSEESRLEQAVSPSWLEPIIYLIVMSVSVTRPHMKS